MPSGLGRGATTGPMASASIFGTVTRPRARGLVPERGVGRRVPGRGAGDEGAYVRRSLPAYSTGDTDSETEDIPLASPRLCASLEQQFKAKKPADIDAKEEELIVRLMRMALQPDAELRASASQLLDEAWFHE